MQSSRVEILFSLSCMWMILCLPAVILLETKKFLSSKFNMKDLGEASFVLGIEIHQNRRKGVLGLSQKVYLENVLKKYSMHASKPTPTPIVKGDSFGKF